MPESVLPPRRPATAIGGTGVHDGAQACTGKSCTGKFGRVCRALWPDKTAEHLSARSGDCLRASKYYIAGERRPSDRAIAAVVMAVLGD